MHGMGCGGSSGSPLSDPRISPPTHISISHIHIDITSNLMPAQASRRRRCRSRSSVRAWRAPSRRRSARRRLVRTRRPAGSLACRCGRCERAAGGGGCKLVASARPSSCLSSAMWACLGERPRRGQSLWSLCCCPACDGIGNAQACVCMMH